MKRSQQQRSDLSTHFFHVALTQRESTQDFGVNTSKQVEQQEISTTSVQLFFSCAVLCCTGVAI